MLVKIDIEEKHMGSKLLFKEFSLLIPEKAKIGLIGRNGIGKTTLFRILSGEDHGFSGTVQRQRGMRIVATAQEHQAYGDVMVVDYVLQSVPDYVSLKEILDTYPDMMGTDEQKIHDYSDAVQTFSERNYYTIEDEIVSALAHFGINFETALLPLSALSGGQKRFVELVRVAFAQADLILLDEPTNHLDYIGKQLFIDWFRKLKTGACLISHDRDVLQAVTMVVEIKDYQAFSFPGNYDRYIKQNGIQTITAVEQYELAKKRLATLHAQIQVANARKAGASDSRPRILADRLQREYDALAASMDKPSFWIDRETTASLGKKTAVQYDRYKTRGIQIDTETKDRTTTGQILELRKVEVGYRRPLFQPISFTLSYGDRLMLRGRNGTGKSTLIQAILSVLVDAQFNGTIFSGTIVGSSQLRVGLYEQEIAPIFLPMQLGDAIVTAFSNAGIVVDDQAVRATLSRYLFDPIQDKNLTIAQLSGGQKARFQLIQMLANRPNLLILDEPTNHLDLPSIEELESALTNYKGAIIYVSHDSYFVRHLGGRILQIGRE